jgi:hypothetical protein
MKGVRIGDKVIVCYDPEDPKRNRLVSFETVSKSDIVPATILLALAAIFGLLEIRRRWGAGDSG